MSEKYSKRVKQCLEEIIESRDDLFNNVQEIVSKSIIQAHRISDPQTSLCEKDGILHFLRKVLLICSELNHTVLKYKENLEFSDLGKSGNCSAQQNISNSSVQELQDYLKGCREFVNSYDFTSEGPKIPNNEVTNNSYVKKQLDNITLKAICTSLINSNSVENEASCSVEAQPHTLCSSKNQRPSSGSVCSDSDIFSSVSTSTFVNPLSKFQPPTEIPEPYDDTTLQKVKESLRYFRRKIGLDFEEIAEVSKQFHKNGPAADDVEVGGSDNKDIHFYNCMPLEQTETLVENVNGVLPEIGSVSNLLNKSHSIVEADDRENESIQLNNGMAMGQAEKVNGVLPENGNLRKVLNKSHEVEDNDNKSIQLSNGMAVDQGEILEEQLNGVPEKERVGKVLNEAHDSIEVSSESCQKVSSWLKGEFLQSTTLISNSTDSDTSEYKSLSGPTAVEKLTNTKRYDRNEEVRALAIAEMPDLRLVSVPDQPKVIVNDLNSDTGSSSTEKNVNSRMQSRSNEMHCLRRMAMPEIGEVCVFSHIESPHEFYLQFLNETNNNYIKLISSTLKYKLGASEPNFKSKRAAFANIGKFCYGYVKDLNEGWFRLQVLDWKLTSPSDEVYVQSVDYGFKRLVDYTSLRGLTADLARIPMLAVKCHFPLLFPPGSTYSNRLTEWPTGVIEALYDLVNIGRQPTDVSNYIQVYKLIFVQPEGSSLAVDLLNVLKEGSDETLGEELVAMGLAVQITDDYDNYQELGEFFEDIDELEQADNLNEFILGYDARDEARICRFTRPDGSCPKKHCKLEHIPLRDGYTTDKTEVFYMAMNDLILPCQGETVMVLVTSYIDSCTYLVQFVRDPVKKSPSNLIMDQEMSDLIDAMNNPKIVSKYTKFKVDPSLGQIILAFNLAAKKWVRVAVRDLIYNGTELSLQVYSVDFGEEFVVSVKNTRTMPQEFMLVPFQAVRIYLDNYQHRTDCDPKKAKKFFEKHILYKNFLAHIKSRHLPFEVAITTLKGREIGPTLVKERIAQKRMFNCHLTDDISESKKIDLE